MLVRIDVSAAGVIAVNDRMADPGGSGSFVETRAADGTLLATHRMPTGWAMHGGLAFDGAGILPVVADTTTGVQVATFDADGNPVGQWSPAGMGDVAGIAIAPVPEP